MIEKGLVFQSQQYSASVWAIRKVRHLTEKISLILFNKK